jgi:hypothetical protein
MNYCKNCQIEYTHPIKKCVLCQSILNIDYKEENILPLPIKESSFFYPLFLGLNLLSLLIFIAFDGLDGSYQLSWFTTLIHGYAIIGSLLLYKKEFWTIKWLKISLVVIALSVSIGFILKESEWTIGFIIPLILFVNIILSLSVILFSKNVETKSIVQTAIISGSGILIGTLLLFLNLNQKIFIEIISIFSSILFLTLLIFNHKVLYEEFKRRFHL